MAGRPSSRSRASHLAGYLHGRAPHTGYDPLSLSLPPPPPLSPNPWGGFLGGDKALNSRFGASGVACKGILTPPKDSGGVRRTTPPGRLCPSPAFDFRAEDLGWKGHPSPDTRYPTPYALHPATDTLHPTPCTLHPTPYTLHPTPHTPHPSPITLHLTPDTPHPTPDTRGGLTPPALKQGVVAHGRASEASWS